MENPVGWAAAERVAVWVAQGKTRFGISTDPLDAAAWSALDDDFAEATTIAESLVVEATGLRPATGPARAHVVDRAGWVRNNLDSFRRLLGPVLQQLEHRPVSPAMERVTRQVSGAQLGVVLGWMSTRVLGQYDLLIADGDAGDVVSYVGPNIVALERRNGFPPKAFRLWIALHEVTHRCQFAGVPWLHAHFLSLVEEGLSTTVPDPRRFAEALRRAVAAARGGHSPLDDVGMLGLMAPPEQLAVLRQIAALMSLLEGHGDITMDRAGADAVGEADWFAHTLRERRKRASAPARLLQQLTGIDAKLRQYQQGESFIEAVEAAGGHELFARVWDGPEALPTMEEIRCPAAWVERMGPARLVSG